MNTEIINKEYLSDISYLQFLLYQDNYYTLKEKEDILKLIKKLIKLLERGEE